MAIKGFAINGRFWHKTQTGVERYAREITARLGAGRLILPGRNLTGAAGHVWEQLQLPLCLRGNERLWSPANSGPAMVRRQILTIQDLSPVDHPEWFRPWFSRWYRWMWAILARRVESIVVPSEFTRQRVIGKYHLPGERVSIVPGGVSAAFQPVSRASSAVIVERYHLPARYFLFVGTLQPRKNLRRLLSAWVQIARDYPKLELLVIGPRGEVFAEQESGNVQTNVRYLGYVPDEHLPALYSSAFALVYPSLYEGFGLPVLEAMACGVPVIASDIAPLRELVGQAGLLVKVDHADSLVDGIRALVESPNLRMTLGSNGIRRAQSYTWDRAAQKMQQIIHGLG